MINLATIERQWATNAVVRQEIRLLPLSIGELVLYAGRQYNSTIDRMLWLDRPISLILKKVTNMSDYLG
jgi:hypothetical protein